MLLRGVASPSWREWSHAWNQPQPAPRPEQQQATTTAARRPSLCTLRTLHRLLQAEAALPSLILGSNSVVFEAREHVPLLRPTVVFLPPPPPPPPPLLPPSLLDDTTTNTSFQGRGSRGVEQDFSFPPTKVGGAVDCPWHDETGRPETPAELKLGGFEFIAQINLEQVTRGCAFAPPGVLPAAGMLYFFVREGYENPLAADDAGIVTTMLFISSEGGLTRKGLG
jgi:hypothetical protein